MAKSEDIDLYSPLPPEEIARKLKVIMDDPMPTATARVFGNGSQYDMTLRYARRNVQNPMAPTLEAAMEPQGEGTRITGTLGQTRSGRLFPFVWHGFLSLFVIVGATVAWFVPDALLFGAIFAGIPLFMMVIGAVSFRAGAAKDNEDRREILRFLTKELDARPAA
ncbi:hypothetical protein L7H23_13570 [Sphingopyxis sp. BSN-002]|uniref:hypothetical protein n=1 Tax=Sphingopyxis sp. BSN-002 TaxID=2911495 RepID=UPI001EDBF216|nr:hypothetical protein [Sphingopyxis sp. BSN-002]UKK83587.1 hypothetical protein L7H23_13570 [Sphingopyxis sp. BSN-002]